MSDKAGHIATLALSGAGVATSVGGSLFTAATSVPYVELRTEL